MQAPEQRRRRMPPPTTVAPPAPPAVPAPLPQQVKPQSPQLAGYVLKTMVEYFRSRGHTDAEREAIDFLRAHAACTLVIPSMPSIERMALEHSIVLSVERDPSPRTASRLASLHNIPRRQVSKVTKRKTGVGVAQRRTAEQVAPQHCRYPRINRFRMCVKV